MYKRQLHALASAPPAAAAGAWRARLGAAGAALAALSLLLQTAADAHKLRFKRRAGADAPMLARGLWRVSRHPNHAADAAFHGGVAAAALAACRSAPLAWLSVVAPAACAGVVVGAAHSLDARQLVAYGERPEYREYVRTTPLLFPFGRAG